MTRIIVEVKTTIADSFGNKVTEVTQQQATDEGNPRFFASTAKGLGSRCMEATALMLQTEYGEKPSVYDRQP